jgi:anaerobic dimethyl sulfoxide reductase subunit A
MPTDSVIKLPVTCNKDCGGGCPLLATIENGRVTAITDNPLAPPMLHGCLRGYQMARTLYAPDRLSRPLLRVGPRGSGQFREIPWPEALARVADRLAEIKAKHGAEAVLKLGGSGSCRGALHNTGTLASRFLSLFGGATWTYGSYSSGASSFAVPFVLGNGPNGMDAATLQYARLIILWGANVADNRLGCETGARIRQAREHGTEVIVIDPRRSATVRQMGTEWIPIYPGTDIVLMMAVLYVLLQEGLVDRAFAERYSVGFGELEQHILGQDGTEPKTPQWAAKLCGTPATTIVSLAERYGRAKPTALIPGLSYQRTIGGEEAVRMGVALQVATGNLGKLGGSSGAVAWGRLPTPRMGSLSVPTPARRALIPVYSWPDAILEGQQGGYASEIKAVYNCGGNYLVQGSDVHKNVRAFAKVDFAVCHDYFLTPTARHCDIVLPTTTWLERQDIVFPDGNFLLFSNRAVPPQREARHDYDIFCALAERLGFGRAFSDGKDEEQWLHAFVAQSEVADYEEFKRTGIYMGKDQLRVGLADFVADPQAHPLRTPSGKVELSSEAYARTGFPAIPQARILWGDSQYPLRMVTPKSRYRTHSQNSNIPWFREREEQALWINPADAAARQIADGEQVLVSSPQGQVRIKALVTEDIMAGVVCLLEGVWPEFAPDGTETAGTANVLTSTVPTEPSHSSRTHSVLVQVQRSA